MIKKVIVVLDCPHCMGDIIHTIEHQNGTASKIISSVILEKCIHCGAMILVHCGTHQVLVSPPDTEIIELENALKDLHLLDGDNS